MHRLPFQIQLYDPFTRTQVADHDEEKTDLGPGIRINGDNDISEDDLIEVTVERAVGQIDLILKRSSTSLKAWYSTTMDTEIVFDGLESVPFFFGSTLSLDTASRNLPRFNLPIRTRIRQCR